MRIFRGDIAGALECFNECQVIYDKVRHPTQIPYVRCGFALLAWREGRVEDCRRLFEEAITVCRRIIEHGAMYFTTREIDFQLMYVYILEEQGDFTAMQGHALETIQTYHKMYTHGEIDYSLGQALAALSRAEAHLGDFTAAREHLQQAISAWLEGRYSDWALFGLYYWSRLLVAERDSPERRRLALELLAFVQNHPLLEWVDYHQAIFGKPALPEIERAVEEISVGLPEEVVAEAMEAGRELKLKDVAHEISLGKGRYAGSGLEQIPGSEAVLAIIP